MLAIAHAQERLQVLFNEMDLVRECGSGSPCSEPERIAVVTDRPAIPTTAPAPAGAFRWERTLYCLQTGGIREKELIHAEGNTIGKRSRDGPGVGGHKLSRHRYRIRRQSRGN